jgi:hypothetical protein
MNNDTDKKKIPVKAFVPSGSIGNLEGAEPYKLSNEEVQKLKLQLNTTHARTNQSVSKQSTDIV